MSGESEEFLQKCPKESVKLFEDLEELLYSQGFLKLPSNGSVRSSNGNFYLYKVNYNNLYRLFWYNAETQQLKQQDFKRKSGLYFKTDLLYEELVIGYE